MHDTHHPISDLRLTEEPILVQYEYRKTIMSEVSADQLKHAVESQHVGKATFIQSVAVKETTDDKAVWEGRVHNFALAGNKLARRAYAWSAPIEGSTKRRFFAVLHTNKINSPVEAVRATIVQEYRETRG